MTVKRRANPLRALDTPLPSMLNGGAPPLPPPLVTAIAPPDSALPPFAYTDGLPFEASVSAAKVDNKDDASCSKTVDYRLPDPARRPMEVKVAGRSLFVDPNYVQNLSPMLTRFFVREMVAGKHKKWKASWRT
uniref:Uncharacterized protein n=1 Tax=Ditylenchus dipsaci TaxID=166011 RepID=A0A915CY97_9BILA